MSNRNWRRLTGIDDKSIGLSLLDYSDLTLWAKCIRFLKKIGARHRAYVHREKIVCIVIRFSVATVVTTVVTTIA